MRKKTKKPIPAKYAKAVAESREYMNKQKEHNNEMKLIIKVNRK